MESNNTDAASVDKNQSVVNNTGISHSDSKKVPSSVTKRAPKKRIDIGKMYEDDFLVLNIRLKQYGYENALSLLKDFKEGIFSERFYKPQGKTIHAAMLIADTSLLTLSACRTRRGGATRCPSRCAP
jgi:uncharacterized membrane protein YjjP (DUF1212 family)